MKVVQLLPELHEGGVERGVVELSRELVKLGVESIVISAGGKLVTQIEKDGGRHVCFEVASKNPLTAPQRIVGLRKLLESLQPDIVHARSRVPAWLAYLANRKLRFPFVTTVHGFNSVNAYSRVMTYGDRVICVSRAIRDHIRQHYQVPEGKTVVIPRGVDLDAFAPERIDRRFVDEFKAEQQLAGRFIVTAVGRITQLKDYETFIRGVVAARDSFPQICGLIVGGVRKDKEQYYQSLQDLVKDLHAEELIRFVGSQNRMAEIYALSDVVVSCSKKPESFGRTAAEALAMDVPVIATNHGGVLDIIGDRPELLFAPGDPQDFIRALLAAADERGADFRKKVTDCFSLQKMVAANFALYQQLSRSVPSAGQINSGVQMTENDFGKYRLPVWGRALAGICQGIPFNGFSRHLLFSLRKPVLALDRSPIDADVKGARFRLYPRQNLSDKRLLCTPDQLDGSERRLLAEKLPSGSLLIDLGANIGGYCLLLAAARKDLRVVAVEADPELAKRLEDNISFSSLAERVTPMNIAVADSPGRLVLQRDAINRGKNTVVEASGPGDSPAGAIEIDAVPLLEILDRNRVDRPGAIKLDLEGFELKVLESFFAAAPKTRWPQYLQLEQHRKEALTQAVELSLEKGYRLLQRTRMNVVLELSD